MRDFIERMRLRLGEFWWYSLMVFVACRTADALNAFVGLWLVPRYISPDELGAVLPLMQFANFLALPAAVFAATFRNELTTLAVNRQFGQMKTLMRGVFVATAVFLVLAIAACRFLLPAFLERIRIVEGSLGLLMIATAFVGAVAPVYQNALQALKKFKSVSLINIFGAPVRMIAMIVAMPFRPLSGYFVGQSATPLFNIVTSVLSLRKELSAKAEPYWSRAAAVRFSRLFAMLAIGSVAGSVSSLMENMVLRQQLPALDSAAYYMVTRFSEIASFLAASLIFTLFPYAAEMNAQGKDVKPLLLKIFAAILIAGGALAAVFAAFGESLLALLPHGAEYSSYCWAIPWMIGISCMNYMTSTYTTVEVAANRFGYYCWFIPATLAYPAALAFASSGITSLKTMLWWMTWFTAIKFAGSLVALQTMRKGPQSS